MSRESFVGRRQVLRAAAAAPVDVALVLAADCSGSISNEALALQVQGYARAITSAAFIAAVQSGYHQRIALTFVRWAEASRQDQAVPWTVIGDLAAARAFVETLLAAPFATPGYTSISGAIDFSRRLLLDCRYPAMRRVIDVSGNGRNNDGRSVTAARDEAVAAGIGINGLPIVNDEADIVAYYIRNVIGGPAAFVSVVEDLESFEHAVQRKLVIEVAAVPVDSKRLA
ncbi:MAG TPA: DUF1194 domain-containing protein [Acetobacteraceae bacterium]|nr:DUF1194 domain-containing protein [Acetobacteraceae bacterium]